jgi:hypothetical protein
MREETMSRKPIWTAVMVTVVCISTMVLYRSQKSTEREAVEASSGAPLPSAREARGQTTTGGTESLERRLAVLDDEVAQLREEVARLHREAKSEEKAPSPEVELSPEEAKAMWDDRMSLVEAGFNEEPTDTRWADDVSARIQRALVEHPSVRAATRSAECRSKTCRVELSTDAQGKLSDEISALTRSLGEQLPTVMYDRVDEPGGRQTQFLYFKREQPEDTASE